ncbi:MAG: fatty acid CoA ligase family protein [Desulfobacteraceae bacterium]
MKNFTNISQGLRKTASEYPHKRAVVYPAGRDAKGKVLYSQITFRQLDKESDRIAYGLEKAGIQRGTRTVLMVPPSMEFFHIIFAMFKTGAIPVVVDPGMGVDRMVTCFSKGKPEAFIAIPKAHLLRILKPKFFKSVKKCVTVGRRLLPGGHTLDSLRVDRDEPYPCARTTKNETAAIVFTTGSTGPAKGVVYTHGNFDAQIKQISTHFAIRGDEIDLPTFPLFALFDPALAMTAVIPDMDPTRPAKANPEKIIEAVQNHGVTNMFASPALLHRVGRYCKENGIKLDSLRRVVSAGAPVSPADIEQFSSVLTGDAEIHTPYGATEAVPVISIASSEILSETRHLSEKGFGICIGRPILNTDVKIIKITDDPVTQLRDNHCLSSGEVGEIIVKAPLVTKHYFDDRNEDTLAKIPDSSEGIWHRMGDLGWMDKKGRIWFCGRKNHRVETGKETLFTIPCESIFNNHENVFRSALAGVGKKGGQTPVIFVEPVAGEIDEKTLLEELYRIAGSSPLTSDIRHIFIKKDLPVDIRHNSKIFREKLSGTAEKLIRQ